MASKPKLSIEQMQRVLEITELIHRLEKELDSILTRIQVSLQNQISPSAMVMDRLSSIMAEMSSAIKETHREPHI